MNKRVILDENVPRQLKRAFSADCFVTTVQEQEMASLKNGFLLAQLEGNFDVFITADKNLRYQQNLAGRTLAIVELPTNRRALLQELFSRIAAAVEGAAPGTYIVVSA